jgi:hypothetical protein
MNNDDIMDFDSPSGGLIDFDATPVAKQSGGNPNIMDFDNQDVMDFDSPPAEPPAMLPSLSGASNPQGVLPLTEATDAGSVAFKAALENAKQESALKTFGREFVTHIAPASVGAVSSVGGAALGVPAGPAGVVAGDIAAGIAGEAAGTKLQRSLFSPEQLAAMDAQEAINAQEHPFASQMGTLLGEVPMMLTGAFFAKKLAMAGIKGAGKAATEEAVKEATGKLGSKLTTSATTFGTMGGAGAASEMVKQNESTPEGERIGYGDIASETIKGGVGGLAIGGASEALGKFIPAAKTYLGGIGIRAPTDALVLTVANNLYDTIVHGKSFEPYEVLKGTSAETPAFMIMNAIMGGHAINRTRLGSDKVSKQPQAAQPVSTKTEPVPWGAQDVNAKINAEVGEAMPGIPKSGYDAMQEQTDVNARVADIHNELNPDAPIEPAPVEQGNIFEPLKQPPPAEPINIQPAADTTIPAHEGAVPIREKYVVPETPVARMGVKALREELKAGGIETTTRDKIVDLRYKLNANRTERLAQEKRLQALETPASTEVKIDSAEVTANRRRGQQDRVSGHSEDNAIEASQHLEDKIRRHIDEGRYLNEGETVYDSKGVEHEVVGVDYFPSFKSLGSDDLQYEVRDMTTGATKKVSGKDLSREIDRDVPFRTVLGEAKGGDAGRAKWIIRKTLGKDSPIEIVERIFEKGAERLGKYQKGLVTIAKNGNMERTAYHEAMHGAEDMLFTAKELDAVKRIMPDAEKRADAFMEYAAGKQGVTGQVKMYFDRLMYRIKKLFGQADGISELKAIHAKLMQGAMAKRGAKVGTGEATFRTPTAYDDVVKKFEAQEQANADKFKRKSGSLAKWFGRNWVSNTSPVELDLRKTAVKGMEDWADPVKKIERDLAAVRGASGEARDAMSEASERIFRSNEIKDTKDMQHFNRLAQARRVVEINELKRGQAAVERQRLIDLDKSTGKTDTHWSPEDEAAFQKQMTEDMMKSPISVDEAKAYIAEHETRTDKARFDKAHDEYQKTYKALLKESLDAGVISKDVYDYIDKNHKNYQPRVFLDKIDPVIETRNGRGGTIEVRNSGLQTLKDGSEGALMMDSPHLLMSKIIQTKTAISKNKATKSLADYLASKPDALDAKIVTKMSDAVPAGKERIFYREDGKMKAMDVNRDFAEAWRTSNPQMTQEAMKIMRYASGTAFVKFLATAGNPEFAVANLPRDLGFTFLASKEFSPFMPVAAYQQLRNIGKQVISKDARRTLAKYYRKNGGSTDYLSSMGHLEDFHNPGAITTGRRTANKVVEMLGYFGNTSEETVRLAHFQQALRNLGVTNFGEGNMARLASTADGLEKIRAAVYAASNVLDFRQAGNMSKVVDQFVPFFNPAVQGARGVLRAFKERPAETSFRASQIIGLGALLAMYNRKTDEKAWESTSDVEKDSKAVFVTGITRKDSNGNDRHVYIAPAIDQGWRPFFIMGQMVGEKLMGKEVDPARITKSIRANYVPYEASNLPPVVAAMLTYSQNHDFWRNEKVWRGREVEPFMERRASTPAIATLAGDVTGMSPERLRAATGKMFPEHVASLALREAADKITGDKQNDEGWLSVNRLPFARKLLRLTSGRDLTHDKELAAKRLGVKIQDKAPASVLNEIEKAEKKQNTYRQKNDVTFDKMVAKVRSGDMTKAELYKAAWQVKNEQGKFDGKERVRILRLLKRKYPELRIVAPSGE